MKTFLFLCFCVVSFFVGFLSSGIIRRLKNKKVANSQQEKPTFEKGDIITFEHCYNNPFGNRLFYLVLDVKLGYNGSWYYKYVKCDHTGVVKPHAVYETDVIFPNTFVKVGFIALS